MGNSEQSAEQSNAVTGKKKRSPVERAIVWGLIAVALLVVLIEWNARAGYSKTLAALQERIELSDKQNGEAFLLDEAKTMISGFPLGKEELTNKGKRLQYHWFSLFRSYDIQLTTDDEDIVLALKTEAVPNEDALPQFVAPQNQAQPNKPPIAAHQLSLPDKGLDREFKDVVVMSTDQLDSQVDELKGILTREIVRQALLIGGRDGLGRKTRDASLRGDVKLVENPELFPLQLITHINRNREVSIDLILPFKTELAYRWNSEPFTLPEEFAFEALVEHSEALSRGGFVEALQEAGYSGKAAEWKDESDLPEKTLKQIKEWSFISQYTVAQDMHSAIAAEGESPERLAMLARAYANLGSLTERLMSPAHKVLKARALLYAERLTDRCEDSPWSLAYRAYVRTFVGRHHSALADLNTIQSQAGEGDGKRPLPEWLDLIEAYCLYKPEVLEKATRDENRKYMAIYLSALQTDPELDAKQAMSSYETLLKLEPACIRALDQMNDVPSLGNLSSVTGERQYELWEELFEKLQAGNLPKIPRDHIDAHLAFLFKSKAALSFRERITRQMKSSDSTQHEPSANALGQLLQEVSYLLVCRKMRFLTDFFSVNPDNQIELHESLVAGHPYGPYLKIYSSIPADVEASYKNMFGSYDPNELEISVGKLITDSYGYLQYEDYMQLKDAAVNNLDPVFYDQLQYSRFLVKQRAYSRNLLGDIARTMLEISPHQPQTIAMNIDANKGYADQHHTEILEKYGDKPEILSAMAKRHLRELNDEKAEDILLRRLALTKDYETYASLAELYQRQGETGKWLDTLKNALRVPTVGLENAKIRSKIAYYHMGRGEWELAEPYAMDAAKTYSAWGLICGARYHEAVDELDAAEELMEGCSKRYEGNAADWYFWCVRTNHGDQKTARLLAERMILEHPYPNHYTRTMEIGVIHFMQGSGKEAYENFLTAYQKHNDSYCGLHAALLADELNMTFERDELLKEIAGLWNKDYASAELANYFQLMLKEPAPFEWDPDRFQSLMVQLPEGSPTNFYFFAGKFLKLRGQEALAENYLQLAAASPETGKYNCALASQYLRALDKKVKPRRIEELPDGYHEVKQQSGQADYLVKRGKWKDAIQIYDEILKSHPKLTGILIRRAQSNEQMGEYEPAIADYKRVIEIDPVNWKPHTCLAIVYGASEQDEFRNAPQSLQHAQQAFDMLPTRYWVMYGALAVAYAAQGEFDKAIEFQKEALARAPTMEKNAVNRRLQLFNEGKPYIRSATE